MTLQLNDWIFDIDIEHTMERSAVEAKDHCTCAYCRNFYAGMDRYLSGLRPLLAQFGIDAEAPDTLYPYDVQKDLMWYEGEYVLFGQIVKTGRQPLRSNRLDSFFINPILVDEYDLPQPHFVLSLEKAQLPWILEEPMEEVVSPANEPTFLDEMWDHLLKKAENTDVS